MVTIGDSFSIVAILAGLGITTWALVLGFTLLFATRASNARDAVSQHPWRSFFLGSLISLVAGTMGVGMSASPVPAAKLLGLMILLTLATLAAVGMGGVCMLISTRIRFLEPNLSVYNALVKGSAIIVIAAFTPFLGWFFLGPILFLTAMGAGTQALLTRSGVGVREGM